VSVKYDFKLRDVEQELIMILPGQTPGIAIFATNARYKKEAFRGSEYAARILSENGLRVVMKSDHPVLDSRFLLYEAAQARCGEQTDPKAVV
jgi:predicted GTPase